MLLSFFVHISIIYCKLFYSGDPVAFRGERATHQSSPGVTRSHCARCGTPIAYETVKRADEIDLYLGAFAEPEAFTPQGHAFFAEHIPWFDTRDELPRK